MKCKKVIDPIYQGSMVMSRRVLIMRHAKSSWKIQALTDHQRPLNKRGRSDAPRIAAALKEMDWIPDRVFVSDSQRTLETLALLQTEFGELPVQTMEELYHPTTATIHACIESAKKGETVLVLSHNPATELVLYEITKQFHRMPAAACALLIEQNGQWHCQDILRPKELD